jgi:hypothetical protein
LAFGAVLFFLKKKKLNALNISIYWPLIEGNIGKEKE